MLFLRSNDVAFALPAFLVSSTKTQANAITSTFDAAAFVAERNDVPTLQNCTMHNYRYLV